MHGYMRSMASLREWRVSIGKTQAWLAEQLDLDQATVSRLEKRGRMNNLHLAMKIADLSQGAVPMESWLPETEPSTDPAPSNEPEAA